MFLNLENYQFVKVLGFTKVNTVVIIVSALTQGSNSDSGESVNFIEKSDLGPLKGIRCRVHDKKDQYEPSYTIDLILSLLWRLSWLKVK